jgi:hypothetical protein
MNKGGKAISLQALLAPLVNLSKVHGHLQANGKRQSATHKSSFPWIEMTTSCPKHMWRGETFAETETVLKGKQGIFEIEGDIPKGECMSNHGFRYNHSLILYL